THTHDAVPHLQVVGADLHERRSHLEGLLLHLDGRHAHRVPTDHGDPAGERPDAEINALGVAGDDRHVVDGDTQPISTDLSERRLVGLALRRRARHDDDLAVGLDPDGRTLERPSARRLDITTDTDSQVASLIAGLLLLAA